MSHEFAFDWAAALTAPVDEELAKAAGLLLLISLAPRLIRSAFDGLIVGAFIGLGFQIIEDVVYGYQGGSGGFGADQVDNTLTTLGVRVTAGFASHWVYSGIFCAGLVWLLGRPDEPRRVGRGLALMLFAMAMHGTWDAAAGISRLAPIGFVGVYVVVPTLLFVVFAWAFKRSVVVERSWMRDVLLPEVESGVLTSDELDAVVGTRKQRKHFVKAGKGHKTHVHAKHVLEGATDLATELSRAGGRYTPEVQRARQEIAALRG